MGVNYAASKAVARIKASPRNNQYRPPKIRYTCRLCPHFRGKSIGAAWTHSAVHGPWPEEGSLATRIMNAKPRPQPMGRQN